MKARSQKCWMGPKLQQEHEKQQRMTLYEGEREPESWVPISFDDLGIGMSLSWTDDVWTCLDHEVHDGHVSLDALESGGKRPDEPRWATWLAGRGLRSTEQQRRATKATTTKREREKRNRKPTLDLRWQLQKGY